MDRQQALLQLNSLTLQCHSCRDIRSPHSILISAHHLINSSSFSHSPSDQSMQGPQATQSSPQEGTQNHKGTGPLPHLFCFDCFAGKKVVSASHLHFQTYHQTGKRFINKFPVPQKGIVEECLKTINDIEEQTNKICRQISEIIDSFKFYIFKLSAEVRKMCKSYEDNLELFKSLKIQQMLLTDLQETSYQRTPGRKAANMNHTKNMIKLTKKLEELKFISKKIPEIKLSMPSFNSDEVTSKRKRTKVLDLPISSLICLQGQKYFGTADGQIIYSKLSSLVFHQAHDSLIRSFSHDDQYTLYSGSDDFSIKAWNTRNGKIECIKVFGMIEDSKSYHRNINVIEEGKFMVSTRGQFDNFRLRVWSLKDDYKNIGVLEGHSSFIKTMVVVDRSKNIIMTGSDDKTIKIWDPNQLSPIRTILRRKVPQNLIVNTILELVCIMEEDNRVSMVDLFDFAPVASMTLSRRILCSCGYSRNGSSLGEDCNDYIAICIPGNVGIWRWDCTKAWSLDLQSAYTPINLMQVCDSLIASDGSGMMDEFYVGEIPELEEHPN